MKKSDAFKLSTLATAMLAIMPALATATATDPTEVTTPEIIKGEAATDWEVTAGAGGTTNEDKTQRTETRKVNIVKTGKDNGLNGTTVGKTDNQDVNMAGIYVGIFKDADDGTNTSELTAEYTGGSINVDVETNGPNDVPPGKTIAAVAVDGAVRDADGNIPESKASTLNLGKKNADGYATNNITLKATNNAVYYTGPTQGQGGNAYAVHTLNKGAINLEGKTLHAEATIIGNDSTKVDESTKVTSPAPNAATGGAAAFYALGADSKINAEADTIVAKATAKETAANGFARAVYAKGGGAVTLKANESLQAAASVEKVGDAAAIAADGASSKIDVDAKNITAIASSNQGHAAAIASTVGGVIKIGKGGASAPAVQSLIAKATSEKGNDAVAITATGASSEIEIQSVNITAEAISNDTTTARQTYAVHAAGNGTVKLNGTGDLTATASAKKGLAVAGFAAMGSTIEASATNITANASNENGSAYAAIANGTTLKLTATETLKADATAKATGPKDLAVGLYATETSGKIEVAAKDVIVNAKSSGGNAAGIAALKGVWSSLCRPGWP